MARPRVYTEERIVTAVRLPISTRTALQQKSEEDDVPMNVLITNAIETYLKKCESGRLRRERTK